MKLINIENNKRVVYIQYKDIKKILDEDILVDWEIDVDLSIIEKPDYSYKFIRIEDERLVNYLCDLDYVNDYTKLQDLTKNEFKKYKEKVKREYQKELLNYTKVRIERKSKEIINLSKNRLNKLDYKLHELVEIECAREGKINLYLPHNITNAFKAPLKIMTDSDYVVNYGLDNNSVIVRRKDNKDLDYDDLDLDIIIEILKDSVGNFFEYFEHVIEKHNDYVYITFRVLNYTVKEDSEKVLSFIKH